MHLGTAWGMTRQDARKRWPHPVSTEVVNPFWRGIATAVNRKVQEAPEDLTYDTREEAAAAGVFVAADTTTTDGDTT